MSESHPRWPTRWLMTDERLGDSLWPALRSLPERSGVVFRHDSLNAVERAAVGRTVAAEVSSRGLVLAVSGDVGLARQLNASLVHRPSAPAGDLPVSVPVHDVHEALEARERGAALAFVSPVFATRSHPGRTPLGIDEAARLAALCGCPAIALGGVDEERFADLSQRGFYGWAGIDAWLRT